VLAAVSLATAITVSSTASANSVTIGATDSNDCSFVCSSLYQQAYAANSFPTGPIDITQVTFFIYPGGILGGDSNDTLAASMLLLIRS